MQPSVSAVVPESQPDLQDPEVQRAINQFSALYPFPLDTFQREAIAALLRGDSVMVAAPTGSGKTVVAEFGIYDAFRRTGRVIYTAPIKALSNQKFRDLREIYADDVGLLTGDVTENRDARIIVMTTEILRNMLLQSPWELDDVDTVIFDEIHYLADPERGTTWEESIILCPEHIQFICLSATVDNADEIAAWIGRTHRPIRLIQHDQRPVPLALYYFYQDELAEVVDHHGKRLRDFSKVGGEARRQRGAPRRGSVSRETLEEPQPHEIVDALKTQDLLPAIYFLFSRNDCQSYAERLSVMRPELTSPDRIARIETVIQTYLESMRPEDHGLEQVRSILQLARKGIGFHHAGLLPILKQLVEVLFGRGLLQVVFATDTLALGVNMPARTVIIGRMSKWDGRRRRPLTPNEFQQMAGRAGRRGMDRYGHVVIPYSPILPFREAMEIATGPLHPVQSAFAIRYNTVLNLWDPPQGDRVRQMLLRSLAQYQSSQRMRFIERDILEIEAELAGLSDGRNEQLAELDELYEQYHRLGRTIQSLQREEKDLQATISSILKEREGATPWTEPGRLALRKLFRSVQPGLVVHLREHGWGVFLGRTPFGVGRFCLPASCEQIIVDEYRAIDFVPDNARVDIPAELTVSDDVVDGLDERACTTLRAGLDALELPDLESVAEEHRQAVRAKTDEELDGLNTELETMHRQIASLAKEKADHPFHDTAFRKAHRRSLHYRDSLEKERNALNNVLDREQDAEDVRIRDIIRGIRDVLHRFGYLQRGYPTEKADMLADIFDNDGLILCELIDRGILEPLRPEELAELFSWFSFDRDFRYTNEFTLTTSLVNVRRQLEDLEHDILGEERDHKLFISEGHNPSFYGPAYHWCRGWTMAEISDRIELSEGDLVITFNKTIDLMRQVREMLANLMEDHPLHERLRAAERLIRRGIVEQSLTLGFAPISDTTDDDAIAEDDPDTSDDDASAIN